MVNEIVIYDRAMVEFFSIYKSIGRSGGLIPIVFAPPQRAFSLITHLYGEDRKRVPLPAMAVHRMDTAFDSSRYVHKERTIVRYDSPPDHTKVKVMGPWHPITIPFVAEMWSYTTREMAWMIKNIWSKFIHEIAYITVDLEEYGRKKCSLRLDNIADTSSKEPGEEERQLRSTVNVTLNAVLHKPLQVVETIKTTTIEYRDQDSGDLLEIQEV